MKAKPYSGGSRNDDRETRSSCYNHWLWIHAQNGTAWKAGIADLLSRYVISAAGNDEQRICVTRS
jgi:hypothetical protein